jgi:predicted lysophospholipase L1 biosynthesis ABC-type transport system permease subunit
MNLSQIRQQWGFYIIHSLRDLRRNGARTIFALFCIATGVAAVVALRSLALMIGDELTLNLAEINRGDIQIVASNDISPRYFTKSIQNETVFSADGVNALRQWASSQGIDIQFASNLNVLQLLPLDENSEYSKPISLIPILIEPEHWAYYSEVFTSEPSISPLSEWFPEDQKNIVISKRVALENDLQIGDTVYAGETALTVAAFVEDETEGSLVLRNGAAGFIGYLYYPLDRAADLNLDPLPERAFVKIPLGTSVEEVDKSLERRFGRGISRITIEELAEQNQETADLVNDLILVMGLSSILIGGMGIINTMNVIVGRRTLEIAVLKTLGLKAWRVTTLFLVEAALMGIIGSLIGVLVGIILSYFIRGVGEEVLQTSLSWRAYPEAWYSGLSLGIVITVSFGFLPTLNAGQVRPAGVLRPNEIELPNAGLKRTMIALILVIVTFGLTLNTIVQGQIQLPIELMLGLGGFIIGLFGGVMLANEGVMNIITPENAEPSSRRAVRLMTVSTSAFLLVILGGMDIFLEDFDISLLMVYGIPLMVGGVL